MFELRLFSVSHFSHDQSPFMILLFSWLLVDGTTGIYQPSSSRRLRPVNSKYASSKVGFVSEILVT